MKDPTLLCKCPEVSLLNGFPPPGTALAPQKITQGLKQCLVRYQLVDSHSARAKESTQWHLGQLAIARPSSCWVGHHRQVVWVTTLAWLQLHRTSAPGHEDKPQQAQLCHGGPFSKQLRPPRSPAGRWPWHTTESGDTAHGFFSPAHLIFRLEIATEKIRVSPNIFTCQGVSDVQGSILL